VTTTVAPRLTARHESGALAVCGVRNPRSVGVARYAALLAEALRDEGVDYELCAAPPRGGAAHYHLANSSRRLLVPGASRDDPCVVTVHDVVPRTKALVPLYRTMVYPQLVRRASAVVVHTAFAADMLVREAHGAPARLEVIPHPARRPQSVDRRAARQALGWPDDALIAVLPGAIRTVKLVRETLAAFTAPNGWRLALAGRLADRWRGEIARTDGVLVLDTPDDIDYQRAIVASDCVLCLRAGSVGETNGPLLDALGAGRAVLATATGSIREVAGGAACYCDGTEAGIRAGLTALADESARLPLEAAAERQGAELTWKAAAAAHAALFREVLHA
jgi:glycosyltransferase involved in cell wall biosynthesis